MTLVRFIGDVHGKWKPYKRVIANVPFSIQAGDMGAGFRGYRDGEVRLLSNPPFDAMSKGRHLFIRGNHDNPEVCRRQKFWIPDGATVEGIYCLGGAVSLDRAYRTEGLDWWCDEELSLEELEAQIVRYSELKPSVVCTHECPESVATDVMKVYRMQRLNDGSRTRQALERMLQAHQPEWWVFGHWHKSGGFNRGRTTFRCLDELGFVDVDI